jgi:hypothetical protein
MKLFAVICTGIVLASSSAHADWQYTKWGMTPEEVVDASKGTAWPTPNPDKVPHGDTYHLLAGTYATQDFLFEVQFDFDTAHRLSGVRLNLTDYKKCTSLYRRLTSTYGPSKQITVTISEVNKWWDHTNGNVVSLADISSSSCSLYYSPLFAPNTKGAL